MDHEIDRLPTKIPEGRNVGVLAQYSLGQQQEFLIKFL